jgi:hypothetical protein
MDALSIAIVFLYQFLPINERPLLVKIILLKPA